MAARKMMLAALLTGAALAAPLEDRQSCAAEWGQCGGENWTGPTCCASGTTCQKSNDWYSQCLAGGNGGGGGNSGGSGGTTTTTTSTTSGGGGTQTTPPPSSGTVNWSGNPFSGVDLWANNYYKSEVSASAIPVLSAASASAAAKVAEVPSFQWLDSFDHISFMADTLADIEAANAAGGNYAGQFVVYDLPDRDCAALASNGEYTVGDNGLANYEHYIDTIVTLVKNYSDIRMLLVIEPDSLANLVTNLNVAKCAEAKADYLAGINYALQNLNLPNVAMYIDAGHAGWLGWSANLPPAAQLFTSVWEDAGRPAALRGLATNVANYNAWDISTPPSYTSGDSNYDEKLYIHALSAELVSNGWTNAHFITDQGRSGKEPTGQQAWGDWCNQKGTGFGTRPTANTGDSLLDAFVWVKPGGESDGTSNSSATRYDAYCGKSDALQPAPEAGTWFEAYFEQLLTNANPSFL